MTPLETLLVCLIAAAGVGMLRFGAHAPGERAYAIAQEAVCCPVRELPKQREVEPALSRPPMRKAS
jgi:hypothetical protein